MPHVHHLGDRGYAHWMRYPTRKFPVVDFGHTQEIESPYRTGHGIVLRLPCTTRALVVGRWNGSRPEDEALSEAIGARPLEDYRVG